MLRINTTLLAALGQFLFTAKHVPFQQYARSQAWKHPNQSTVGNNNPPSQYTGADPEEITIEAELRPEITGSTDLSDLRQMANTGQPYPLIWGDGIILGSYVITGINEQGSQLNHDGSPRAVSLSLSLKKVADTVVSPRDQALLQQLGMIRKITGI